MAVHLEFVVGGPPVSHQQRTSRGRARREAWKATVKANAQAVWIDPILTGAVQTTILNFHSGVEASVDVDNMAKPIHDAMVSDVYVDDRQIRQAHITHLGIDETVIITDASALLVTAWRNAVVTGSQFLYIRVEDPVLPYPLPA